MALDRISKFVLKALFGGTGGQVLTKSSGTDGDYSWEALPEPLPGGTAGQLLTKTSGTAGDYAWAARLEPLPGGTAGQILTKTSGTAGDYAWAARAEPLPGGTAGQILTKTSGTAGDYAWATPGLSVVCSGVLTAGDSYTNPHGNITAVTYAANSASSGGGQPTWTVTATLPFTLDPPNMVLVASGKGLTFSPTAKTGPDTFVVYGHYTDDAMDSEIWIVSFVLLAKGA